MRGSTPGWLLPALAGVFCFSVALFASDDYPHGNPHAHFQNPEYCPQCHLFSRDQMETERFSTETDAVCLGCHKKESLGRSHPLNVRPREKSREMKIPPDFRLDDDGRIMCLTCHTAHGAYLSTVKSFPKAVPFPTNSSGGPYYQTFFLRRSSPTKGWAILCDACHKKL